jgi:putative mRNA 3-end processing factor
LTAIDACNPETVWLTHGYTASVARYFVEQGRDARVLDSRGRSEVDEDAADEDAANERTNDSIDPPPGKAKTP